MALPTRIQAAANRLIWFLKPVPLATTVGVILVGVFIWEYVSHPEWFGPYTQEATPPSGDLDLSGLTPEEQAAVANIDNLTVLFNELGIESGGIPNVQALPDAEGGTANASLQEALSLSQPSGNASTPTSPFAEYLEQYQFSVQMPQGTASAPTGNQFSGQFGGQFSGQFGGLNLGGGLTGSAIAQPGAANANQYVNPLATALQTPTTPAPLLDATGNPTIPTRSPQSERAPGTVAPTAATNPSTTMEGEFNADIVTIPGIDQPFLPNLPQMSPPPGTTGYTPPASLELMPPLPGQTPAPGTTPAAGVSAPSRAGTLDLSGRATPTLTSPEVNVNDGYVTPYVPTTPTVAPSAVPAAPFSAPRPPGSYTGSGYINTFSNPSSPHSSPQD